jgi:hypothetical protein
MVPSGKCIHSILKHLLYYYKEFSDLSNNEKWELSNDSKSPCWLELMDDECWMIKLGNCVVGKWCQERQEKIDENKRTFAGG